jgi:ATPase family associated with various cellular activities (AAA)
VKSTKATTAASLPHPFKAIRRAGVPLVAFETADPAQTIRGVIASLNGKGAKTPVLCWDILRGLFGLNEPGSNLASDISPNGAAESGNPAECLRMLAEATGTGKNDAEERPGAVIFFCNAQAFISEPTVLQGVWNLRDKFKGNGATLVLLCPSLTLPAALSQDVVKLSEALPTEAELATILDDIAGAAGLKPEAIAERPRVVNTLLGLSAFSAEQTVALSLSRDGVNMVDLWERKKRQIENTPGITFLTGEARFADLRGQDNLQNFARRVASNPAQPIGVVVFLDELEKSLGGSGTDTSGTSQDQLGVMLKEMQDNNATGIILLGHGGTGKSNFAKAFGNEANAPTVCFDLGAMKGSLVGQSEERIRSAWQVIKAIAGNASIFVVATCNAIQSLPPPLRRRFTLGTFFMDLPTAEERAAIWPLWVNRYKLDAAQTLPKCEGWTGAEIRACCDVASRTGLSLAESAAYVVPVIKSAPDQVESLRKLASGRFISASSPGVYQYGQASATAAAPRSIQLEGKQ